MDLLSLGGFAIILTLIVLIILFVVGDADLTTLVYEKLGKNVSRELKDKVVWITGASAGE